ncbi:MAG: hypothetical protein GY720_19620, partial [bacterium]|nr:hypothetical protein [bacterium]
AIGLGSHSESNWGTGNSGNSRPCDGDTVSDAWYAYENSTSWPVQLDVTVTPGSSFDGLGLEAVSGCGGSSLACASVVDGQPASITFDVPAEAEGKFRVASVFGDDSDYELLLEATDWPVWNDICATAESISPNDGTLTWTTTGATATSPMAASSAINQDVWFQYTNPYAVDRFVRLTTQKLDLGDEFAIEVYDACGGQLMALAPVAANASVGWLIPGGATHKMRVASTGAVGEPNWFQVMLEEDSAPFPAPVYTDRTPGVWDHTYVTLADSLYSWGYEATQDIDILELGIYDESQDGLDASHEMGIYDIATEQLLVYVQLQAGTAEPLIGDSRYTTLDPPLQIKAGQTFVVCYYNENYYEDLMGNFDDVEHHPALVYRGHNSQDSTTGLGFMDPSYKIAITGAKFRFRAS